MGKTHGGGWCCVLRNKLLCFKKAPTHAKATNKSEDEVPQLQAGKKSTFGDRQAHRYTTYMDYVYVHVSRLRHRTHEICFEAQVIATKYHGTFASQSSKHTRHEVLHLHREKSPFRNRPSTHGYKAITPATQNT